MLIIYSFEQLLFQIIIFGELVRKGSKPDVQMCCLCDVKPRSRPIVEEMQSSFIRSIWQQALAVVPMRFIAGGLGQN